MVFVELGVGMQYGQNILIFTILLVRGLHVNLCKFMQIYANRPASVQQWMAQCSEITPYTLHTAMMIVGEGTK